MFLVRYDEIVLKGKNRKQFEKTLFENIKFKAKVLDLDISIIYRYGKFIIKTETNKEDLFLILQNTPGINSFAEVYSCEIDQEKILEKSVSLFEKYVFNFMQKDKITFKVETKRSNKNFPMKSPEVSKWLGWEILKKHQIGPFFEGSLEVDVKNPDITIFVNISEKETYIYNSKNKGMGGLPVRSLGRVVSLLSGGIDSPVASLLMMSRGCEIFLFHAYNHGTNLQAIKNKVELLSQKLANFQGKINLVMMPYRQIQKEIIGQIQSGYRMIVFKRSIFRVANILAEKIGAKAIITGDSVGQVASQTLENINCIYSVSSLPVLSPLIGMQKIEIINLAKKFGTYETSILPYDDCCSLISTGNPVTKGILETIEEIEQKTKLKMIEKILTENIEIIKFEIKK